MKLFVALIAFFVMGAANAHHRKEHKSWAYAETEKGEILLQLGHVCSTKKLLDLYPVSDNDKSKVFDVLFIDGTTGATFKGCAGAWPDNVFRVIWEDLSHDEIPFIAVPMGDRERDYIREEAKRTKI